MDPYIAATVKATIRNRKGKKTLLRRERKRLDCSGAVEGEAAFIGLL
jgi:hypothetical protein